MSALRAMHASMRQVGLTDDDAKRDLYARVTGKRSAAAMSEDERKAVLTELKRLYPTLKQASNGTQRRRNGQMKLTGKYAGKLQALWIAGWNLAVFRDRDDAALVKFCERQTGMSHVRFVRDADDALKVIEALKSILAREGGVDWARDRLMPRWCQLAGARIAAAQFDMLEMAKPVARRYECNFRNWLACEFACVPEQMISERDWQPIMNALGERIRVLKEAA